MVIEWDLLGFDGDFMGFHVTSQRKLGGWLCLKIRYTPQINGNGNWIMMIQQIDLAVAYFQTNTQLLCVAWPDFFLTYPSHQPIGVGVRNCIVCGTFWDPHYYP